VTAKGAECGLEPVLNKGFADFGNKKCEAIAFGASKSLHFYEKLGGEFGNQSPEPPFFVICGI
jgi:hypothetical protein